MPLATDEQRIPDLSETFPDGSFAYFIGISQYKDASIPTLSSPENDIKKLQNILIRKHGFKVENVLLKQTDLQSEQQLNNPLLNPAKEQLLQLVNNITCKENSRLLFYFACHGVAQRIDEQGNPEGFLIPSDATLPNSDTYVKMSDIHEALCKLDCRHLLIILDCCYAGAFKWAEVKRSITAEKPPTLYFQKYQQYVNNKVKQVITSAAADQQATDFNSRDNTAPNSPFAVCLADALNTEDADYISPGEKRGDGIITVTELGMYLRNNIQATKQIPAVWNIGTDTKGEFVFLNPVEHERALILLDKNRPNPYKGLATYSEEDKNIFFGRQRALDGWKEGNTAYIGLCDAVKNNSVILVTGRSGIGKSSLVKAGVLSSFNKELVRKIKPGSNPVKDNEDTLNELINNKTTPCCLLVDQYEELVTTCRDDKEREQFEHILATIAGFHKVIITVRSDFEIQFRQSPIIGNDHSFRFAVPPFTREDFNDIVTGPANLQALEYRGVITDTIKDQNKADDAFVNRLVDDAYNYPDSLPLLSLALNRLYEKRESDDQDNAEYLTEEEYNSFKGITGIIEEQAESVFNKYAGNTEVNTAPTNATVPMSADQQLFMQLLFRMMSFEGGEITKRRVYTDWKDQNGQSYSELQFSDDAVSQKINDLKEALINARLLKADTDEEGNKYAEPAHEALLRSWPRLTKILYEKDDNNSTNQEKTILLKQVSDLAREYHFAKRKNRRDILWVKDYRLQQVLQLKGEQLRLNEVEEKFIDDSHKAKRRNKNILIALSIATIVASITIAIYFLILRNNINDQLAQTLWDQGINAGEQNEYTKGLLYTAEALNRVANSDLQTEMLMSANNKLPAIILQNIITVKDSILGCDFSKDGKSILILSSDSTLQLYNAVSGNMMHNNHQLKFDEAFFCENGTTIIGRAGNIGYIMDTALQLKTSFTGAADFTAMDADSAGNKIVTGTEDSVAGIWKYDGHKVSLQQSFTCNYALTSLKISPDDKYLFTVKHDDDTTFHNQCDLWDIMERIKLYSVPDYMSTFATNRQLTRIFVSYSNYHPEAYEVNKSKKLFKAGSGYLNFDNAVFVNDDSLLLTDENGIAYWSFDSANRISNYSAIGKNKYLYDLQFCKKGNYFSITDEDGKSTIGNSKTLEPAGEMLNTKSLLYKLISTDGRTLVQDDGKNIYIYKYIPTRQQSLGDKSFAKTVLSANKKFAATADENDSFAIWDIAADTLLFKPHKWAGIDAYRLNWKSFDDSDDADSEDSRDRKNIYSTWRGSAPLIFNPAGTIITPFGDSAILYDFNSHVEKIFPADEEYMTNGEFEPLSPDGKQIIYVSDDSLIHLLKAPAWKDEVLRDFGKNNTKCYFLGKAQKIITVENGNTAYIRDLTNKSFKQFLYKTNNAPINIIMNPDCSWGILHDDNDIGGFFYADGINTPNKYFVFNKDFKDYSANSSDGKFLYRIFDNDPYSLAVHDIEKNSDTAIRLPYQPADPFYIKFDIVHQLLLVPTLNNSTYVLRLPSLEQEGYKLAVDKKDTTFNSRVELSKNGKYILNRSGGAWHLYDYTHNRMFAAIKIQGMKEQPDQMLSNGDDNMMYGMNDMDHSPGNGYFYITGFDLDIPKSLFILQANALTGIHFNKTQIDLENIPPEEWRKLKAEYKTEGEAHYKTCKYKRFNTWAKVYPQQASKYH